MDIQLYTHESTCARPWVHPPLLSTCDSKYESGNSTVKHTPIEGTYYYSDEFDADMPMSVFL
jgi:hypothetical protein